MGAPSPSTFNELSKLLRRGFLFPPTRLPPARLLTLVPRPRFHLPPLSIQNRVPGREAINLLQRDGGAGERRGCSRLPAVLTPTEQDTRRGGRRRAGGEAGRVDGETKRQSQRSDRRFKTRRSLSGREAASALTGVPALSSAANFTSCCFGIQETALNNF